MTVGEFREDSAEVEAENECRSILKMVGKERRDNIDRKRGRSTVHRGIRLMREARRERDAYEKEPRTGFQRPGPTRIERERRLKTGLQSEDEGDLPLRKTL